MSATHYASLKRWDELYVLLIRKPHLADELDLWSTCQEKGAPARVTDLIPSRPRSIKTTASRKLDFDQCGNLILNGQKHVYTNEAEGIIKRDKNYRPVYTRIEDV
jgi:hypothetical protein